jgi:O-6-methylguanine DNA methyltransferase
MFSGCLSTGSIPQLRAVDWTDYESRMLRLRLQYGNDGFNLEPAHNPHGLRDAIKGYFAGDVQAIDEIPVQTAGTPFQRSVWNELRRIPSGDAISYGKLAEQIARPKAVRAVGLANGVNPIGIVVPCHRVIGANGSLPVMEGVWNASGGYWSTNGSTAKARAKVDFKMREKESSILGCARIHKSRHGLSRMERY